MANEISGAASSVGVQLATQEQAKANAQERTQATERARRQENAPAAVETTSNTTTDVARAKVLEQVQALPAPSRPINSQEEATARVQEVRAQITADPSAAVAAAKGNNSEVAEAVLSQLAA